MPGFLIQFFFNSNVLIAQKQKGNRKKTQGTLLQTTDYQMKKKTKMKLKFNWEKNHSIKFLMG